MAERRNDKVQNHPNVKARILPHNDEAEQALLGCLFINEDAPVTVLSEVKPDDFYQPAHRDIFQAMLELYWKDKPIDIATIVQQTEEMGVYESVGGVTYISTLSSFVPSGENYVHYMEIVKKNSLLRQLIASTQKIMDCAYSVETDQDALALAESEVYTLAEKKDRHELVDINEAVAKAVEIMDEKQANPTEQNTVPIPFTELNKLLGGFHNSDLVLIAARPAQGKTSLGMNLISHAALDKSRRTPSGKVDPFKCAVFSLEMSAEQIATRLLCSVAKVSMQNVKDGTRTAQETLRLMEAQKRLSEAKIYIDDNALTTPMEILSKCRRLKRDKGLDLIMVDYLQLMTSGKRVESRQQEVSDITRTMKIAAKELNVPILLLSQMSRDIEKRTDKKPQMSDLRESGAIEQDADIIIFLHREHDKDDMTVDEDTRTKCDLIVAKHRNGSTGTVTVRWHGEYTTFTDLYEKSVRPEMNMSEPSFRTHFSGVEEGDQSPEPIFDAPVDAYEPPAEKEDDADVFTPSEDPFDISIEIDDDEDII